MAQPGGAGAGADAADPGELDHQAAERGAAAGQVDTDSLPDYPVLDAILELYVDRDRGADEIVAAGFDRELVTRTLRMVDTAEYKRRQYPPGTKISAKGFGKDRRLPITNRWRESG